MKKSRDQYSLNFLMALSPDPTTSPEAPTKTTNDLQTLQKVLVLPVVSIL